MLYFRAGCVERTFASVCRHSVLMQRVHGPTHSLRSNKGVYKIPSGGDGDDKSGSKLGEGPVATSGCATALWRRKCRYKSCPTLYLINTQVRILMLWGAVCCAQLPSPHYWPGGRQTNRADAGGLAFDNPPTSGVPSRQTGRSHDGACWPNRDRGRQALRMPNTNTHQHSELTRRAALSLQWMGKYAMEAR